MHSRYSNILRYFGVLTAVLALCMVPSLITALICGEKGPAVIFAWTIAGCAGLGVLFVKGIRPSRAKLRSRDGFLLTALAWLLSSAIGTIPLIATGAIPNFVDAFFEMCSGFTTTGSTILTDVEALPRSILFWRSFTHWIGGMGIIVFTTAIMPSLGLNGELIAKAETPGPTFSKLTTRYSDTARGLYLLYLGFTVAETVLLLLGGMTLFDALTYTFGTVGTGGFAPYNDCLGHYPSLYLKWVLIIFMTACGTNFNLYFDAARRGPKSLLKDEEFRLYMIFIAGATAGITADLLLKGTGHGFFKTLTASAFHVTSIITTTGFSSGNYDLWPTFARMLLLMLYLIGACSSSTGGGIKVIRISVALKLIRRGISLKLHPRRVLTVTYNGQPIKTEVTTKITGFIFVYILTIFAGMLLVSVDGKDLMTTLSSVLTTLGNVGPGFSAVGPTCNFSFFSPFVKIVLSLLMVIGRLELFTMLVLVSPSYWRANHQGGRI